MSDPPPDCEGDPPVLTRVPVVETVPSTSPSDSSAHPTSPSDSSAHPTSPSDSSACPTPFQQLPYRFNQGP